MNDVITMTGGCLCAERRLIDAGKGIKYIPKTESDTPTITLRAAR